MTTLQKEIVLKGTRVAHGVSLGPIYSLSPPKEVHKIRSLAVETADQEVERYQKAIFAAIEEIEQLQSKLKKEKAFEGVQILESHLQLLQDPLMTTSIEEKIRATKRSSLSVLSSSLNVYRRQFASLQDPFFQERFKDIQDVAERIINHLRQKVYLSLENIPKGVILFADELSPTEVATLQPETVLGLVTRQGGPTSHAAIIARSRGIPCVTNIALDPEGIPSDQTVILDASKGEVILHPSPETLAKFQILQGQFVAFAKSIDSNDASPFTTKDGCEVSLYLNVNHPKDVQGPQDHFSGVGLFRTEFLLDSTFHVPSEETQFAYYKELLEKFHGKSCVIRVFDFGGDKAQVRKEINEELNPSLGYRAIRLLLKEEAILDTQLKALLRASVYGKLCILLPMVTSLDELRQIRQKISSIQETFRHNKIPFCEDVPVGCMVEVPAACMIADHLAKESDFFSFGTNDLVQYLLAVDRTNHLVTKIYTPYHPSVFRMLHQGIRYGEKKQIPMSLCGEMGVDPRLVPILLGLGIRKLSISPSSFSLIQNVIQRMSLQEANLLTKKALKAATGDEIEKLLTQYYQTIVPEDCRF